MIALAAAGSASARASAMSESMTRVMRRGSSGSPITPVEAMKISLSCAPVALAAASATWATAEAPTPPVKALALPELTISARARPPFRCSRHQSTGAEGHLERVNTPATAAGRSNSAIMTSVRPS